MGRIHDPAVEAVDARLRRVLEANGQRFTGQRSAVYRFLCGSTSHPTADEVFTGVRQEIFNISLATVYKALEALTSCQLATKLTFADGSGRFDARTDEHFHARCVRCGAVRDIEVAAFFRPLSEIHPTDGFRVEGYRFEVVGCCDACVPE